MLKEGTPLALLAMGEGLVLATGGVDISIAGVATASGVIFATCTQAGFPLIPAGLVALCFAAMSGLLLGQCVNKHAPPMVMSWAFGVVWLIASLAFSRAQIVLSDTTGVPLSFTTSPDLWHFGNRGFIMSLMLLATLNGILPNSNLPRQACAVGANRDSAVYAGLRVGGILRTCYTASALFAGMAGILWCLISGSATTTDHVGRELTAVAIAVLGGTVMSGGYLCFLSIMCAAFFWTVCQTLIVGMDLSYLGQYQQHAANGLFALILILILLPLGGRLSAATRTIHTEQKTGG